MASSLSFPISWNLPVLLILANVQVAGSLESLARSSSIRFLCCRCLSTCTGVSFFTRAVTAVWATPSRHANQFRVIFASRVQGPHARFRLSLGCQNKDFSGACRKACLMGSRYMYFTESSRSTFILAITVPAQNASIQYAQVSRTGMNNS